MKIARTYTLFFVIVAVAFLFKFYILNLENTTLDDFRGGNLAEQTWNPLVANDVNGSTLTVAIDNHEFTNQKTGIYMDDNRNIMVPVSMLRDALNCSAHVYSDTKVLVEKHEYSYLFDLDSDVVEMGEETYTLSSPLTMHDDELYISLNDLSALLQYNSIFDMTEKRYSTADTSEKASIVPARYDLRERERASFVRDQGSYGTCWAFSTLSALESSLRPERTDIFAVDHMAIANSFQTSLYQGGDFLMGMAYLAAWQGPVYEADDPYGDLATDETLTPALHVQEMRVIDGKDYEAIKTAVFQYGGVETSLYISLTAGMSSSYYNEENAAYCYVGAEKPNHGVVIIGWDDNYPRENFKSNPEGDGAFICQNSWGEGFGEDGVFYVSYYDTNIGTHNVAFTRVESADNYDNIYQSDLCGWTGKIGYDKESIYGANVFTANGDETVTAAAFYATGANSKYRLYVVPKFEDETSFQDAKLVAEGTLEQAGYYTIPFNYGVKVKAGEEYAVVLYIETPGATHPLAMEFVKEDDEAYANVDLEDGLGFISSNGTRFTNVMDREACNLCIKAFTMND